MTRTSLLALVSLVLAGGSLLWAQAPRSVEAPFTVAEYKKDIEGDLPGAIAEYLKVAETGNPAIAAEALWRAAEVHERLGDGRAAAELYQRIVVRYPGEPVAARARARRGAPQTPSAEVTGPVSRMVWTMNDHPLASLSPDGGFIAYSDRKDVFLRELAGGATRNLTNRPPDSQDKAYETFLSPDGTQVAYNWWTAADRRYSIRIASTSGEPAARVVYEHGADAYDLYLHDWSPDGRTLAVTVQRNDNSVQIGLLSVADGRLNIVRTVDWQYIDRVKFAPDGQYVAYERPAGDSTRNTDVFVLALDGRSEVAAATGTGDERVAAWSPDGRWLLFTRTRLEFEDLWAVPMADGRPVGAPQQLYSNIGADFRPVGWAEPGRLYYLTLNLPERRSFLHLSSLDVASGRVEPTSYEAAADWENASSPSFSPDGTRVAYLSERRGRAVEGSILVIYRMDTGRRWELRPSELRRITMIRAWSPDGRSVLVQASTGRDERPLGDGIYRIDIESGEVSRVLRFDRQLLPLVFDFAWLPDGVSFIATVPDMQRPLENAWYPIRVDVRTSQQTRLDFGDTAIRVDNFMVGVDGTTLYYKRLNRSLADATRAAFVAREMTTGVETILISRWDLGGVHLSPDGRFIGTFGADSAEDPRVLLVIPTAGSHVHEVELPAELNGNAGRRAIVGWTADSRSLLLRSRNADEHTELWQIPLHDGEPRKLDGLLPPGAVGITVAPDRRHLVHVTQSVQPAGAVAEMSVLENFLPQSGAR